MFLYIRAYKVSSSPTSNPRYTNKIFTLQEQSGTKSNLPPPLLQCASTIESGSRRTPAMGRPRPLRVGTRQPLQSRWSRPDESTNIKGDIVYQCHVHGGHLGCSFTYNALLDRRARHCRAQDVYLACVGTAILNPRPQTSGVHAYVYTLRCRDFEVVRSSIPYRRSTTRRCPEEDDHYFLYVAQNYLQVIIRNLKIGWMATTTDLSGEFLHRTIRT
jgi:hypothetical protein